MPEFTGSVIRTYDYVHHLLTERANALYRAFAEHRSCSTCCHWYPDPGDQYAMGECRLVPPLMRPEAVRQYQAGKPRNAVDTHVHSVVPKTPAAFWCSHWRRFPGLFRLLGKGRV